MRIAIPANSKNVDDELCPSFARAPYFYIYNTDDDAGLFIENLAAQSSGGAGIKAAQFIVDEKIVTVVAPRLGKNAADVLIQAQVEMIQSKNLSVRDNIQAYLNNELETLMNIHAGFHRHGGWE